MVVCLGCLILKGVVLDSFEAILARFGNPMTASCSFRSVIPVVVLVIALLSMLFYFTLKQIVEKKLAEM